MANCRARPGIRLNFYGRSGWVVHRGADRPRQGAIEVGMCNTVAIFRSMNGYPTSASAAPARAPRSPCAG
jgi:hypothetical protein